MQGVTSMNARLPLMFWLVLQTAHGAIINDPGQGIFAFTGSAPGLSGITWLGGNSYYAVSDSAGAPDIYPMTISLQADGTIGSASLGGAFALAVGNDPEGIAFHPGRGTLFVSDETYPNGSYVREFNRFTGALVNTLTIPEVMLRDRVSRGFEALTLGAGAIWTANEDALEHESHPANGTEGAVVRLQRFSDQSLAPSGQWAYRTDPSHGVPDLAALADGRLLVLERSYSGARHNAIYLVHFSGATDTSGIADLDDAPFTLASKTLLWEATVTGASGDFEGMTLGPQIDAQTYSLLLIADNGSGSEQSLYPLTLYIPEPASLALLALSMTLLLAKRKRPGRSREVRQFHL
jgi:hypothetical protein